MAEVILRPERGGALRPFGTAIFIRDFLAGRGPNYGGRRIDPQVGAPQVDIHEQYKNALHRAYAEDMGVVREERDAERENRVIDPDKIVAWTEYYLERIPYKLTHMRYHSFVVYFRLLKALGWVEPTGRTEPSALQDNYPDAPPRIFYRLTGEGRRAGVAELSDPIVTLYGYDREKRSPLTRKYVRPLPPRGYTKRRVREMARRGP